MGSYCIDIENSWHENILNQLNPITMNTTETAKKWLLTNEIRIKSVYVPDGLYDPNWIYINRIGNCSKPKFRVLENGRDTVKNCIKITFNQDRHDREYLRHLINSRLKLIAFYSHGSCHRFINHDIIAQVISGLCYGNKVTYVNC